MKRIFVISLVLVIVFGLLSSCGSGETQPQEAAPVEVATNEPVASATEPAAPAEEMAPSSGPKGTLTVALAGEPNTLYIPVTSDTIADTAASQLYDSLVWQDDSGNYVPALAESWMCRRMEPNG